MFLKMNVNSFIYSIYIKYIEYLLCVRLVLGTRDLTGIITDKNPCPHGACISLEEIYSLLIGNICRDVGRECWTGAQCWLG